MRQRRRWIEFCHLQWLLVRRFTFRTESKRLRAKTITIGATASSGLTVAFTSLTTGVCTIRRDGNAFDYKHVHDPRFADRQRKHAPAPNIDQGFVVSPPTLTAQTIAFVAPGNRPDGAPPFEVNLSASSGLTVSAASLTPAICTLNGTTVTVTAIGTCTIRASQAGNATLSPAPNVDRSFVVTTAAQTINFSLVGPYYLNTAPAAIHASATSGLPVGFSSMTPTVCRMNDNSLTILTMGTCTIRASQSGSANYSAAPVSIKALPCSRRFKRCYFHSRLCSTCFIRSFSHRQRRRPDCQ